MFVPAPPGQASIAKQFEAKTIEKIMIPAKAKKVFDIFFDFFILGHNRIGKLFHCLRNISSHRFGHFFRRLRAGIEKN
jgi:hypothetical protein